MHWVSEASIDMRMGCETDHCIDIVGLEVAHYMFRESDTAMGDLEVWHYIQYAYVVRLSIIKHQMSNKPGSADEIYWTLAT